MAPHRTVIEDPPSGEPITINATAPGTARPARVVRACRPPARRPARRVGPRAPHPPRGGGCGAPPPRANPPAARPAGWVRLLTAARRPPKDTPHDRRRGLSPGQALPGGP